MACGGRGLSKMRVARAMVNAQIAGSALGLSLRLQTLRAAKSGFSGNAHAVTRHQARDRGKAIDRRGGRPGRLRPPVVEGRQANDERRRRRSA